MADFAEAKIEEIRVELDSFGIVDQNVTRWPLTRWAVGKLQADENDRPPRMSWVEVGGALEDAKTGTGGIALDAARYDVTIWHHSVESCRATIHNLYAAMKNAVGLANMTFGSYTFVDDAHLGRGRKVKLQVVIKTPVSGEPTPTTDIDSHDHAVLVGATTVC